MDFFPAPAGSAAIEELAIGIGPIGSVPFAWQNTAISQYANSPRIMNVVASFAAAMDQSQNLDNFYDMFWNVQTAVGYGLDVWGRIVGVSRVVNISPTKFFGFDEGGTISYEPFNQAPFYSGQPISTGFRLDDDPYRQLIYAKAAANIWDGSIPQANAILRLLFPGRIAYVIDNQDMTMTYWFGWTLSPVEASVAITTGILPRPSGVAVIYHQEP